MDLFNIKWTEIVWATKNQSKIGIDQTPLFTGSDFVDNWYREVENYNFSVHNGPGTGEILQLSYTAFFTANGIEPYLRNVTIEIMATVRDKPRKKYNFGWNELRYEKLQVHTPQYMNEHLWKF